MDWDEARQCYSFRVTLGEGAAESFLILVDGHWEWCMHPDIADASPYFEYQLCGPDIRGRGTHWTIGKHHQDLAAHGATYEVIMGGESVRGGRVRVPRGLGAAHRREPPVLRVG